MSKLLPALRHFGKNSNLEVYGWGIEENKKKELPTLIFNRQDDAESHSLRLPTEPLQFSYPCCYQLRRKPAEMEEKCRIKLGVKV